MSTEYSRYEEVHPPVDDDLVTRFPGNKMLLYDASDYDSYIEGHYVDLERVR